MNKDDLLWFSCRNRVGRSRHRLTRHRALQAGGVTVVLAILLSQSKVGAADAVAERAAAARPTGDTRQEASFMKIRLTVGGKVIAATLNGSAAARDFAALLPLTLSLDDYAATEKIAYLPKKLSTAGAPDGFAPLAGDIAYYAPWGNVAIFHKAFRHSEGLISLGRVDSGMATLTQHGVLRVTIERIEK